MSDYENPWVFNSKIFTSDDINGYFGFVYLIINKLNGRKYIGRKYFRLDRKPPKGQRKRIRNESNWKEYYGSSEELKADVDKLGKENFQRIILSLHKTKGACNYTEVEEQFKRRVLFDDNYYNSNTGGKYRNVNITESVYGENDE